VLVGDQVVAVLEFFSDKLMLPDERSIGVMAGAALQLGRVIERANFEEHLLGISEEVQRAIAQDLHDDVGQEITGLALKATTLAEMLATFRRPAASLAADIDASAGRTQAKIRGLSRRLLPVVLEEGVLAVAIGELVAAVNTDSRITCTFDCNCPGLVLDSRTATHLYRIAQEAVCNALRHSDARSIRIALEQQNGDTVLRIEDDGTGVSRDAVQASGMGLRTMRYRAGLIGGELEIGRGPSGGVSVLCRLTPRDANLDA
jgi:signal transduction histidine kinase